MNGINLDSYSAYNPIIFTLKPYSSWARAELELTCEHTKFLYKKIPYLLHTVGAQQGLLGLPSYDQQWASQLVVVLEWPYWDGEGFVASGLAAVKDH